MLAASFQKEWLVFRRDGRLLWLMVTLLIMTLLAIASSSFQYQQQQSMKANAQDMERDRWVNQGEKNPHSAAHYGVYLFKPAMPLSVIDPGLNNYLGDVLFLEAHKRNNPVFASSQDSIELQRFGTLNPAVILQLFLPLFIVLIGFGFFSQEREQGTMRMLLLSGQTPRQLFFQKGIALLGFSLLFLLFIATCSCLILFDKEGVDFQRLISMGLLYLGYLIFWVLLTLVVSALTKTARKSLTVLLIFWSVTSLIVPKLAIDIATKTYPGISTQEFYARMESDLYTAERLRTIEQFKQDTLKQHGVSNTADLPFNWAGAELMFGEAYSDKVFDGLFDEHAKQLEQQEKLYQQLSLLSPVMAIQILSSALANTDGYHHQLFLSVAEQYRRSLMHKLNSNVRDHKEEGHKGDQQLWNEIPAFSYELPQLQQVMGHYTNVGLSAGVWSVMILIASSLVMRRLAQEEAI